MIAIGGVTMGSAYLLYRGDKEARIAKNTFRILSLFAVFLLGLIVGLVSCLMLYQ